MDDLHTGISQAFADKPFDQQALSQVVREKGQVANWNLRRITRDQTNKAISNLTQARHLQLGNEEYVWRTVQDERVLADHADLEGTTQRWDQAPAIGHPGEPIQCRCVAEPVIPKAGVTKPPATEAEPEPPPLPANSLAARGATRPALREARANNRHLLNRRG
ncbi:MAG: minor capsid protein [Chloroflexi bacterium]|nr:minor capsid protein [Chloroflexota bacterium]